MKIKPCPFCGGNSTYYNGMHVVCKGCRAKGPECDTETDCMDTWNERHEEPALAPGKGKRAYLWAANEVLEGRKPEWRFSHNHSWDDSAILPLPEPAGILNVSAFEARKPIEVHRGIEGAKWAVEQLLTGHEVEWVLGEGIFNWELWRVVAPHLTGKSADDYLFRLATKESK